MALFKKKKDEDASNLAAVSSLPTKGRRIDIASREYKIFRRKAELKFTWYEKLARFAGGLIDISFDKKSTDELKAAIDFTGLRIKPTSPFSLMIITVILFSFAGGFFYAFRPTSTPFVILIATIL
ncbi:MAG: hypothetical protein JSV63_01070, partial [Candidatus Aenigmatarchaeota archaeon]